MRRSGRVCVEYLYLMNKIAMVKDDFQATVKALLSLTV